MVRVAIPRFKERVSPVFDSCTRVLIVDFDQDREVARSELYLNEFSLTERVSILQKSHVATIICGGVSGLLQDMLKKAQIGLIPGIAGEVEQVVDAYLAERLDEPRFQMPGYRGRASAS